MYRKYRIVDSIASSVSQYESYRDQVYRYTPTSESISTRFDFLQIHGTHHLQVGFIGAIELPQSNHHWFR